MTIVIIIVALILLAIGSLFISPSQPMEPDNDPLKPRWYWFT